MLPSPSVAARNEAPAGETSSPIESRIWLQLTRIHMFRADLFYNSQKSQRFHPELGHRGRGPLLAYTGLAMADPSASRRFRFGLFEADPAAGELRRQGMRIKINAQPFQVLCLLLARPGELLTREEIARELWPGDTFVDFEHGLNSAINRIREALGDSAANPRFVETLARRGYRFIAPVDVVGPEPELQPAPQQRSATEGPDQPGTAFSAAAILASPEELPRTSPALALTLFLGLQLMYLGFYIAALANLSEIDGLLAAVPDSSISFPLVLITAVLLIPARAFVLSAFLFRAPRARHQFLRMWPFLAVADVLWALSPFLLLHHIGFGVALAFIALLVYSPFAQRSLVLMGAGSTTA
jgi:cholera toxin transcriptional activator